MDGSLVLKISIWNPGLLFKQITWVSNLSQTTYFNDISWVRYKLTRKRNGIEKDCVATSREVLLLLYFWMLFFSKLKMNGKSIACHDIGCADSVMPIGTNQRTKVQILVSLLHLLSHNTFAWKRHESVSSSPPPNYELNTRVDWNLQLWVAVSPRKRKF